MSINSQGPSHRGLSLPNSVRRHLQRVGIRGRADVGLEHQHLAQRYVIRGVESGGAIREMGHYVTFCGTEGEPLAYLHPIDAIGVNGVHAVVVAPALVRVEMLRTCRTYELLISAYRVGESDNGRRPPLDGQVLFRGVHGYLDLELWEKDKRSLGDVLPAFYSRGGEPLEVPAKFKAVTRAVTRAVACCGCSHCHYLAVAPVAPAVGISPEEHA